jgi:hypothetical protein
LRSIRCFFVERASISSWFTVLCFIVTVLLFLAIHLCQLPSQKVSGQLPCTKPGKWAVSCLAPSQESERSVALHQARNVSRQLPCTKPEKWAVVYLCVIRFWYVPTMWYSFFFVVLLYFTCIFYKKVNGIEIVDLIG